MNTFYIFYGRITYTNKSVLLIIAVFCFLLLYGCSNSVQESNNNQNSSFVSWDTNETITNYRSISAEIEKVWTTRETEKILKNGSYYLYNLTRVHCHFSIYNYKERTGSVVLYIEPQYSEKESEKYYTYDSFTTSYESSEYKDFWVDIRDEDLKYNFGDNGIQNYKVKVLISDDQNNKLAESNYIGIRVSDY
ncbi:MAG: hypothetical protein IJM43_06270 [Bacteroidaceae bacterium]|nr:hypothetical protein [Bacteroidaceae bacterium]